MGIPIGPIIKGITAATKTGAKAGAKVGTRGAGTAAKTAGPNARRVSQYLTKTGVPRGGGAARAAGGGQRAIGPGPATGGAVVRSSSGAVRVGGRGGRPPIDITTRPVGAAKGGGRVRKGLKAAGIGAGALGAVGLSGALLSNATTGNQRGNKSSDSNYSGNMSKYRPSQSSVSSGSPGNKFGRYGNILGAGPGAGGGNGSRGGGGGRGRGGGGGGGGRGSGKPMRTVSQSRTMWVPKGTIVNGQPVPKGYVAQYGKPGKKVSANIKFVETPSHKKRTAGNTYQYKAGRATGKRVGK